MPDEDQAVSVSAEHNGEGLAEVTTTYISSETGETYTEVGHILSDEVGEYIDGTLSTDW